MSPAPNSPRRLSELGALRIVDAEKWARTVRKAVRATDGYLDESAETLGVSRRTLQRWLADEQLSDVRDLVASRSGVHREK